MVSCSICLNPYNETEHRPKVLSCCGHTFCLKCLLTLEAAKSTAISCPKCNQRVSQRGAAKFFDNFELISLIDQPFKQVDADPSRLFCLDCDKVAKSVCLDGHTLRGLAGYRRERLQERKEVLGDLELQVKKALEQCVQLESEKLLDQELQLLRYQLPVTISSDTWRAEAVELQKRPALRLALLQLLQEGELLRMDQKQAQSSKRTLQSLTEEPQRKQPRVQNPQEQEEPVQQGEVHGSKDLELFHDPDWTERLERLKSRRANLSRAASTLQEVYLYITGREDFLLLQRMPRLRKLSVSSDYIPNIDPVLPVVPLTLPLTQNPVAPRKWQGRLEWLEVRGLRKDTTLAMLKAHRDSLRELVLWVGPPPEPGTLENWPETCSNLSFSLLQECGLPKLSSVTLHRWRACNDEPRCARQLLALRANMPRCKFTCSNPTH